MFGFKFRNDEMHGDVAVRVSENMCWTAEFRVAVDHQPLMGHFVLEPFYWQLFKEHYWIPENDF
jgi:hypothetical protein